MVAGGEAEIRALLDERAKAIRAKDVAGSLASYASDVLAFDLIDPLRYSGAATVRSRLEDWFASFEGEIDYETRDLSIAAGGDVAYAHGLDHVHGTTTDGETLDMWWRVTLCFRRLDGRWTVTHSHTSVPFDMKTLTASLELEP